MLKTPTSDNQLTSALVSDGSCERPQPAETAAELRAQLEVQHLKIEKLEAQAEASELRARLNALEAQDVSPVSHSARESPRPSPSLFRRHSVEQSDVADEPGSTATEFWSGAHQVSAMDSCENPDIDSNCVELCKSKPGDDARSSCARKYSRRALAPANTALAGQAPGNA